MRKSILYILVAVLVFGASGCFRKTSVRPEPEQRDLLSSIAGQ